jgi:hypothetical protein
VWREVQREGEIQAKEKRSVERIKMQMTKSLGARVCGTKQR